MPPIAGLAVAAVIACALGPFAPGRAAGGIVVVDFENLAPDPVTYSIFHNVDSGGFRFSPGCHIDVVAVTAGAGGQGISWDGSGCLGVPRDLNPDYLGTPVAGLRAAGTELFIDHDGDPFALLSVDLAVVSFAYTGGLLRSSRGGLVEFGYPFTPGRLQLSGPQWQGLDWILFSANDAGAPALAIDNLTAALVPAAGTLGLSALALVALAVLGRHRHRSRVPLQVW